MVTEEQDFCPFKILNIDPQFHLEEKYLDDHYFHCQRQFHPDGQGGGTQEEAAGAAHISALINRAYLLLKNPIDRGFSLLAFYGFTVPASLSQDPSLLEEMMEIKEGMMEDPEATLKKIRQIQERLKVDIGQAFACDDYLRASSLLVRAQYLHKTSKDS
jgi:molecular chaperone HscB